MKLLIINGPNLNMLGKREADIYGSVTLDKILSDLEKEYEGRCGFEFFQSNSEGDIVTKIQQAAGFDGIIINAGAYTHTSVALRDALLSVSVPFVEVHISNVYKRESFRHKSYLSDAAEGVIAGLGAQVYSLAAKYFISK